MQTTPFEVKKRRRSKTEKFKNKENIISYIRLIVLFIIFFFIFELY